MKNIRSGARTFGILAVLMTVSFGIGATAIAYGQASLPRQSVESGAKGAVVEQPIARTDADGHEAAWKAVERIDDKIANLLIFSTVFVGLIAALIGLFEYIKIKEVENLRSAIKDEVDFAAERRFMAANSSFERRLSAVLISRIEAKTLELSSHQIELDALANRVVLAYVNSELARDIGGHISYGDLHGLIELGRALIQLRSGNNDETHIGLSYVASMMESATPMTLSVLMGYLAYVLECGLILSFDNQSLGRQLLSNLEGRLGFGGLPARAI